MRKMASQARPVLQPRTIAAAMMGAATARCAAYTVRHQRCSMVRPRSIASHAERRRSVMARSVACTVTSREQKVGDQHNPERHAHADLRAIRNFGERRPERLYERGGEKHHRRAVHDAHRGTRRGDERGFAARVAGRDDGERELEAGGAGKRDGEELERGMSGDERPEGLAESRLREIAGDGAEDHTVRAEEPGGADAGEHAAGESLK